MSNPAATISPSQTTFNEGETLSASISTTDLGGWANYYYSITGDGLTNSDFNSGLTGQVYINGAGEGSISHPTQALLDIKTINDHKNSLDGLKIVIAGDLDHSRVTSSFVEGISNFPIESLTFSGHPEMCTKYQNPKIGKYEPDMVQALQDADVVMTLRIQHERFEEELNLDLETYKNSYQLSSEKLENAKGDAIIMHPGPVNYVEITEAVYDSENSVIRQQIANGVAIRIAVLSRFLSG